MVDSVSHLFPLRYFQTNHKKFGLKLPDSYFHNSFFLAWLGYRVLMGLWKRAVFRFSVPTFLVGCANKGGVVKALSELYERGNYWSESVHINEK